MNKTTILAVSLAMLLQLPSVQAGGLDDDGYEDTPAAAPADELAGLGAGAILGAVLGGPIGAIFGGLGGGMMVQADNETRQAELLREENVTLQQQLQQSRTELAALHTAHAQLGAAHLQQVNLVQRQATLAPERIDGFAMNVQFRRDSHQVESHFTRQLQQFARSFAGIDALHVHISGHADRDGSDAYNDRLSQQRLDAVSAILVNAGWPAERIHQYAQGERAPLVGEKDREGYAFDRRVVIRIGKAGEGV